MDQRLFCIPPEVIELEMAPNPDMFGDLEQSGKVESDIHYLGE